MLYSTSTMLPNKRTKDHTLVHADKRNAAHAVRVVRLVYQPLVCGNIAKYNELIEVLLVLCQPLSN